MGNNNKKESLNNLPEKIKPESSKQLQKNESSSEPVFNGAQNKFIDEYIKILYSLNLNYSVFELKKLEDLMTLVLSKDCISKCFDNFFQSSVFFVDEYSIKMNKVPFQFHKLIVNRFIIVNNKRILIKIKKSEFFELCNSNRCDNSELSEKLINIYPCKYESDEKCDVKLNKNDDQIISLFLDYAKYVSCTTEKSNNKITKTYNLGIHA